ncbi:MAG TPA: hypothetical protein VIM62_01060 [Acidobacteriaceae bacterium]
MAQSSSSAPAPEAAPQSTTQAPQQAPATTPPLTVQARIRARREARRAAAIHDVYTHLYEAYAGSGYLRFHPGPHLQRANEENWNIGFTRYFSERLGVTVDGRGYYGKTFTGINEGSNSFITNPIISQYTAMIGPTYRFLINPRYSVSGRVLAGAGVGNFSGDLGAFKPSDVGLYSDGASPAISLSLPVEYNVSPTVGLRIAPEYVYTRFGSETQNSLGFTGGLVVRWGKQ